MNQKIIKSITVWLLIVFSLTGCGTTYLHATDVDGENLSILSPKKEMVLLRFYNMCPAFSNTPTVKNEIWLVSNFNASFRKEDVSNSENIIKMKNCSIGADNVEIKLLTVDSKLFVKEITINSDTWAPKRIFLYGEVVIDNKIIYWKEEIEGDRSLSPYKRISSIFDIAVE